MEITTENLAEIAKLVDDKLAVAAKEIEATLNKLVDTSLEEVKAEIEEIQGAIVKMPSDESITEMMAKQAESFGKSLNIAVEDIKKSLVENPISISVKAEEKPKPNSDILTKTFDVKLSDGSTAKVKFLRGGVFYVPNEKRQMTAEEIASDAKLMASLLEKKVGFLEVVE